MVDEFTGPFRQPRKFIKKGLLVLEKKSGQDMLLPIFYEERELVCSVLLESMEIWKNRRVDDPKDPLEFYQIAVALGKKRANSRCFIGPEAEWAKSFESAMEDVEYAFRVDLESRLIIALDKD